MRIRLASLAVAVAMISSLGGASVFAHPASDPKTAAETRTSSKSSASATNETKPDEKLRVDMLKLVADAKAGKVAPRSEPQFPRSQKNNLSTGAKIGIVAAIAGAIVLILVVRYVTSD